MTTESGLEHLPGSEGDTESSKTTIEVGFPATFLRLLVV